MHDSWLVTLAELLGALEQLILSHLLLEELVYEFSFFLLHVRHVDTTRLLLWVTLKVPILKVVVNFPNPDVDRRDRVHQSMLLIQARLMLSRLELAH